MHTGLTGKVALVTASTQGIGFATARTLAQEGAEVWVHGRGGDSLQTALNALQPAGRVRGVGADLATDAGLRQLLDTVPEVDILVNAYADISPKMLMDNSFEDWMRIMRNNVAVAGTLGQHYLPAMLTRGWGRMVLISSDLALHPLPHMVPYSAGKMAQLTLMRALADLTAGTAVTVNAVLPGFTRTERTEGYLRWLSNKHGMSFEAFMHEYFNDPGFKHRHEVGEASSLVKRLLEPQEVANFIVYLCSALASAHNGASLRCDGGSTKTAV